MQRFDPIYRFDFQGQSVQITQAQQHAANAFLQLHWSQTRLMASCVVDPHLQPPLPFLPLSVSYQEKAYCQGRIPGGFFKREGKPGDQEILLSRLIDRVLRANLHPHIQQEIDLQITLLSTREEDTPHLASLLILLAHLTTLKANLPHQNPLFASQSEDLLVVSCPKGILTLEGALPELSASDFLLKIKTLHETNQKHLTHFLKHFPKSKKEETFALPNRQPVSMPPNIPPDFTDWSPQKKQTLLKTIKETCQCSQSEAYEVLLQHLKEILSKKLLPRTKRRLDDRKLDEIRPLQSELNWLTSTHGSAFFGRGQTQALGVITLGGEEDRLISDAPSQKEKNNKSFFLHYNMPSWSVGEIPRRQQTSRREIGHGYLTEKAFKALLPHPKDFPFATRAVSEILSSDGSSSMASVCAISLACITSQIPLKSPAVGISLGLFQNHLLVDMSAEEDALSDMDFKLAGTEKGFTAVHLDLKCPFLTLPVIEKALLKARKAHKKILKHFQTTLKSLKSECFLGIYPFKAIPDPQSLFKNSKRIKRNGEKEKILIHFRKQDLILWSPAREKALSFLEKTLQEFQPIQMGEKGKGFLQRKTSSGYLVKFKDREGFLHESHLIENENKSKENFWIEVKHLDEKGQYKFSEIQEEEVLKFQKERKAQIEKDLIPYKFYSSTQ